MTKTSTPPSLDARRVMSEQDFYRLIDAVRRDPSAPPQTELLFYLGYLTGLRVSEIVALSWGDIDLEQARILVRRGKGGRPRKFFFGPICRSVFASLRKTKTAPPSPDSHLFLSQRGPLSIRGAQHLFLRYRRVAGLPDSITFHSLRHGAASRLIKKGCSVVVVRDLLGHRSISTTNVYLHLVDEEEQLKRAL